MAKYSVKIQIEVEVYEHFEVGEEYEVVENKLTDEQWNEIVNDAIINMDTDDLSGNVVEIMRVEDDE